MVFKIQREVNRALVEGSAVPFHENENIDRLADFAAESGANKNRIRKSHTVLVPYLEKVSLDGVYPTLEVMPGDWDPDTHGETEEAIAGQIAAQSLKESMVQSGPSKFFITVSRRAGLKRLHLTGCFVRPDRCCEVIHLDVVGQDDFDAFCKGCHRKMLAESGKDGGELSSSTASSSSVCCQQWQREGDRSCDLFRGKLSERSAHLLFTSLNFSPKVARLLLSMMPMPSIKTYSA